MIVSSSPPKQWLAILALVALIAAVAYAVSSRPPAEIGDGAPAKVISALENARRPADAERVRQACAGAAANGCECSKEAARRALDRDLHAEALTVLSRDPSCAPGAQAEALARAGRSVEAIAQATPLAASGDPFASYALAHARYAQGDVVEAAAHAAQAAARGRGAPARLLLGLIAFRSGDLTRAREEFSQMLASDADDVDALYNLAVVAGAQNRYRDAREGYLRVLKLDPRHLDARYNLGLLTHSAGASLEAQHHLQKLERTAAAGDPRVVRLRQALAAPAPDPRTTVAGRVDGGR